MKLLKFLVFTTLAYSGYSYWQNNQIPLQSNVPIPSQTKFQPRKSEGFVAMPPVQGYGSDDILLVGCNGSTDYLAKEMSQKGVSFEQINAANFDTSELSSSDIQRMNEVMMGPPPIVFVRGRAKAGPTIDEVMKEIKGRNR